MEKKITSLHIIGRRWFQRTYPERLTTLNLREDLHGTYECIDVSRQRDL